MVSQDYSASPALVTLSTHCQGLGWGQREAERTAPGQPGWAGHSWALTLLLPETSSTAGNSAKAIKTSGSFPVHTRSVWPCGGGHSGSWHSVGTGRAPALDDARPHLSLTKARLRASLPVTEHRSPGGLVTVQTGSASLPSSQGMPSQHRYFPGPCVFACAVGSWAGHCL